MPLSQTVYVNVAMPTKVTSGMKVTMPPSRLTVPCVSAPDVAAVTAIVCVASFNGPGVSFVSSDAALIVAG